MFEHGVASGDPRPDGVVLWTRAEGPEAVRWLVGQDVSLANVAASGEERVDPGRDHTVHVAVRGLQPATTYYYQFEADGHRSTVGRTRTAPALGTMPEVLRIGVVACAALPSGYFNAYRHLAERDLDVVVHLGDYVYEQVATGPYVRVHDAPTTPLTLEDYRRRHRQYRLDPDLQRLHARHPVVAIWDDHDIAADAWRGGASGHHEPGDGPWARRRDEAAAAFLEWLPVERRPDAGPPCAYRSFTYGALADLVVIDTRLAGRTRPVAPSGRPVLFAGRRGRSLLGEAQWQWLTDQLTTSGARWRLIANQVMLAPFPLVRLPGRVGGLGVNPGQWDGYPEERERLLRLLARADVGDTVVLSGDVHASLAIDLRVGGRSVAAELITPAVTSPPFPAAALPAAPRLGRLLGSAIVRQHPSIRWANLVERGYVVVELRDDCLRAQWWHVETVSRPSDRQHLAATVEIRTGDETLRVVSERPRRRAVGKRPTARPATCS